MDVRLLKNVRAVLAAVARRQKPNVIDISKVIRGAEISVPLIVLKSLKYFFKKSLFFIKNMYNILYTLKRQEGLNEI